MAATLLTKMTNANQKPFYSTFLNRVPTQPEVDSWVAVMRQGVTDEAVIDQFVASNEYFINHQGATTTQADKDLNWVRAAFNDLLDVPRASRTKISTQTFWPKRKRLPGRNMLSLLPEQRIPRSCDLSHV